MLLATVGAERCPAQDPVLALHSNDSAPAVLYTLDHDTGQTAWLWTFSQPVTAAAFNPMNRKVYAVSNDDSLGNPMLVFDPATGVESQLPGSGVDYARMECSASGWIYGVKLNSPLLYRIDPATGVFTLLGALNTDTAGTSGDLAFAPGATTEFYYLVSTKFYRVDILTLTATVISSSPLLAPTGLAFSEDGRLWASDNDNLFELDPATGDATLVGPFNSPRIIDLGSSLAPMFLNAIPDAVAPGDSLQLLTMKGRPGGLVGTIITRVNGVPMYQPIMFRTFDAQGQSVINATTPSTSGFAIGVVSLGFATSGRLIQTNEETITIQ